MEVHPSILRNRQPISQALSYELSSSSRVLEIGCGSGAHLVYFHDRVPFEYWLSTEIVELLPAIRNRQAPLLASGRVGEAVEYRCGQSAWPSVLPNTVFTANTFHIMGWSEVCALLHESAANLPVGGKFIVYGPFKPDAGHNSEGNCQFDASLREAPGDMGIRALSDVTRAALENRLQLASRYAMPSSNMLLCFVRNCAPADHDIRSN